MRFELGQTAVPTYLTAMRFGSIRRWFMLFVLGAFLCAGVGQTMPRDEAVPMSSMAMGMGDSGSMPVPCKGCLPNCFLGIQCIFLVALPPTYTPTTTPPAWSRVVYASVTGSRAGMLPEPDLGPPIYV